MSSSKSRAKRDLSSSWHFETAPTKIGRTVFLGNYSDLGKYLTFMLARNGSGVPCNEPQAALWWVAGWRYFRLIYDTGLKHLSVVIANDDRFRSAGLCEILRREANGCRDLL